MEFKAILVEYYDGEREKRQKLLEAAGCEVTAVPFGMAAMEKCRRDATDLIVIGNLAFDSPDRLARDLIYASVDNKLPIPLAVWINEGQVCYGRLNKEEIDLESFDLIAPKVGESDQTFIGIIREMLAEKQRTESRT